MIHTLDAVAGRSPPRHHHAHLRLLRSVFLPSIVAAALCNSRGAAVDIVIGGLIVSFPPGASRSQRCGSQGELSVCRRVGRIKKYDSRTNPGAQRSTDLVAPRTCDEKNFWHCGAAIRAEKSLTALLRTAMILCREPAVERPDIGEAADAEAWNAALRSASAAESEAQLLCSPPTGPLAGTLRARDEFPINQCKKFVLKKRSVNHTWSKPAAYRFKESSFFNNWFIHTAGT